MKTLCKIALMATLYFLLCQHVRSQFPRAFADTSHLKQLAALKDYVTVDLYFSTLNYYFPFLMMFVYQKSTFNLFFVRCDMPQVINCVYIDTSLPSSSALTNQYANIVMVDARKAMAFISEKNTNNLKFFELKVNDLQPNWKIDILRQASFANSFQNHVVISTYFSSTYNTIILITQNTT